MEVRYYFIKNHVVQNYYQLTDAELGILAALANGDTTGEIALRSHRSASGLKQRIYRIQRKLFARNRVQAVAIAIHVGLVVLSLEEGEWPTYRERANNDPPLTELSLPSRQKTLTPREQEVFECFRNSNASLSNGAIADTLSIEKSTLRRHLRNIYGKLDIQNRSDLIRLATQTIQESRICPACHRSQIGRKE